MTAAGIRLTCQRAGERATLWTRVNVTALFQVQPSGNLEGRGQVSVAAFPSETKNILLRRGETKGYLRLLQFQLFYLSKQHLCLLLLFQPTLFFLLSHSFQRFPPRYFILAFTVLLLFKLSCFLLSKPKENMAFKVRLTQRNTLWLRKSTNQTPAS